jgi:hypothetical protein
MSEAQMDTVLAGSRQFALALFVPLTEQVGTRPRVATDATQALTLMDSPRGLVVVEVEGEGSVRSIRELLATRGDLSVIAAVPGAMASREDELRSLGVELARWDGSPAAVLGAVSRRLAPGTEAPPEASAAFPSSAAVATAPRPAAAAGPTAAASAGPPVPADLDLSDDLDLIPVEDLGAAEAPPPAAAPQAAPPPAASTYSPPPGAAAWPAGGLTFDDAEKALQKGLSGRFAGESRLRTVTEGVVNTLCALEFAVVSGDPVAVDPQPIRRAALMRLRVAAALADRPPEGSAVDQGALSAMLGEIDALLSEVNALSQGAPPDVQASLEAVRNALVKEAIDFSEAAQSLVPGAAVLDEAGPAPVRPNLRAARARVLSISTRSEPTSRRHLVIWGLFLVAVIVAGGFHGYGWWARQQAIASIITLPGQPAGLYLVPAPPGQPRVLIPVRGAKIDRAELERFKNQEQAKGNTVEELKGGGLLIRAPALGRSR